MIDWILQNYIEILGLVFGVAYVILAARQNIWCWATGIVNVSMYIYIFYVARLYGDMSLQIFYLVMSFYGIYQWKFGKTLNEGSLSIRNISPKILITSGFFTLAAWMLVGWLLTKTSSDIPYWDGLTTALGLTATWMTARKYIENWMLWIFTDALCVGIYFYKELNLTAFFYGFLTLMAIYGYREWKKQQKALSIG
ncbi:MAG: nicotinamide mononucleotide transporter [Bacteroidales bacterium]|nr:nicotinamide mononucleotide transporter [Bacteroidales bacterium]